MYVHTNIHIQNTKMYKFIRGNNLPRFTKEKTNNAFKKAHMSVQVRHLVEIILRFLSKVFEVHTYMLSVHTYMCRYVNILHRHKRYK